tara:strand:- start:3765 stop:4328 length:564 start_codon:yes stop_codon:yes gene_type:complete
MATPAEKKQKETRRQEVLLKHATSLYLNEDMTLNYASIVYENVKELMSVTKISKELALKYLNDAMVQGQDIKTMVEFTLYKNTMIHHVKENCSQCGKEVKILNGLERLQEDDGETTCLVSYQWFYDKREIKEGDDKRPYYYKIGRKTHLGICGECVPDNVVCYEEDLGEDVDLWNGTQDTIRIEPTD